MDKKINQVLRIIMRKIYEERMLLPEYPRTEVRYEKVQDGVLISSLIFRARRLPA